MIEDWFQDGKHFCMTLCHACSQPFSQKYRSPGSKWLKRYCSRACVNRGRKHTVEWKVAMSARNSGESNPFYGKVHTDATRELMSAKSKAWHETADKSTWKDSLSNVSQGTNNHFFGRKHTSVSRSKMSSTRSRRIAAGEIGSQRGTKGWHFSEKSHQKMRYDSFFELVRMMTLDADPEVVSWTKNHGIRISYELDGIKRTYVPDFLIRYSERTVIEEVKGYEDLRKKNAKYEALKSYASTEKLEHNIVEYDVLNSLAVSYLGKTIQDLRREYKCHNAS